MRLIDADKVLEKMKSTIDIQDLYLPIHFQELIIDNMETAYDVDKVVEQLEKYRNTDFADGWELIITDLIEIVKAGGVDGISRKRA